MFLVSLVFGAVLSNHIQMYVVLVVVVVVVFGAYKFEYKLFFSRSQMLKLGGR